MRMTASWLDPPVGSTEYKDVARDLCAHCGQARLRSSYILLAAGETNTARLNPTSPSLAAVLWSVKEWPGNDLRVGDLARRPSLTDPCARRSSEPAGRDGRMGSAAGRTKG
jgi:hypothetical protein